MKIIFEQKKCIGCGSCAAICPENWELQDNGKSMLLDSQINKEGNYEKEASKAGCSQEAADSCPSQCIFIIK